MAPVWARNRLKRVVKTDYGHVLESFVFSELLKHTTTSDDYYRLLYYRDADKFEIDVVIENSSGQLVGVEVKASATVKESDLRELKKLVSLAGDQFAAGVILYDGDETMPLDSNLRAAPLFFTLGFIKRSSNRSAPLDTLNTMTATLCSSWYSCLLHCITRPIP